MRGLIRDENGAVVTVLLMIMLPVLLVGVLLSSETPRLVRNSDPDLASAVVEATRAAAMSVDEKSQANGDPRIDPDAANETFRKVLAMNLHLSETDLTPLSGSAMGATPEYVLVVYNGDNNYVSGGAVYQGGACVGTLAGNFPRIFAVGDLSIVPDGSGGRSFTLDAPGCLAVVRCKDRPVAAANGTELVRYAVAKIRVRQ